MTAGIKGQRVVLRSLCATDLETLRGFVNDPEVMQHSNSFAPIHEAAQRRWYESMSANEHAIWFGIAGAADPAVALVGTCCLVDIDRVGRQAELRIRIGDKRSWGGGMGTEACSLLLRYGFEEQNLQRIWLRVFARNERATGMYRKLGFREEGRLRRGAYIGGQHDDVILMGLLREEWTPERGA